MLFDDPGRGKRVAIARPQGGATASFAGIARGAASSKSVRYAVGTALFVGAVGLPLLRQTGTRSWQTIWAEDGSVYFEQAHRFGVVAVLFRGYGGYLQLPPRILGGISTFVPVRELAVYFALSAAVVDALLAYFVFWASAGWIKSGAVRVALASLVVLMPALGHENTATITNTIWVFAAVAPWALISKSERPGAVVARSGVAFLAATATPLVLLFVPLGIVDVWRRRTRAAWTVCCAFGAGIALQIAVSSHTEDARTAVVVSRNASKLAPLVSVRVFAQYLLGDKWIDSLWRYRHLMVVLVPLVVLSIVLVLLMRADREHQLLAGTFVALGVAAFIAPVWERGTNRFVLLTMADAVPSRPHNTAYIPAGRFVVVPVVLLACAIAVLVGGSPRRGSASRPRLVEFIVVGQVALLAAIGFSISNPRSAAPDWTASLVRSHRAQCSADRPLKTFEVPTGVGVYRYPIVLACRDFSP